MSGETTRLPIAAGDLLANGRYRVEEVLGEGGMGVVCAATHVALGQRVAVKFLLPQALEHPQAVARFEREARASASLMSEHVVRVTDVGHLESGAPYFVMEFLEGEDLAQRLRREGPLEVRTALSLMAQACEGLVEAHGKGLVHRDIKPSNLFLATRASGKVVLKVIDFGIAKAEVAPESGGHELTRTSEVMGSPQYMSPEQLRDTKNVDARTDLWSLGAAFYECLTGRAPFTGASMTELVVRIATEDPTPLVSLRPEVPVEVAAIVHRCLARPVGERYASASDLLAAIERLRGSASLRVGAPASTPRAADGPSGAAPYLAFDDTAGPISSTRDALPALLAEVEAAKKSNAAMRGRSRVIALVGAAALVVVAVFAATRGEVRVNVGAPAVRAIEEVPAPSALPTPAVEPARGAPHPLAPQETVARPERAVEADAAPPKAKPKTARPKPPSVNGGSDAPARSSASESKRKYEPGFE